MSDESKTFLESSFKVVQECLALTPVIILGSGHSAEFGIPNVSKLTEYLRTEIPKEVSANDKSTWENLEKELAQLPLEAALEKIPLSVPLADLIINKTWECIYPADKALLAAVIDSTLELPLIKLYDYLFRSTHPRISLITTNYDRLAEFAADLAGYAWTTRFGHGYIGHKYTNEQITVFKNNIAFRMIDIWKVHGSIDWYRRIDGTIFNLPATNTLTKDFAPVIVTPGIDKYRRTHEEPFRTIITGADNAIDAGNSFFCVGYGFNDEHIQPKLLERCRRHGKSIVILVKELTSAAKKVLLDGNCKKFIAFEQSSKGTRIFCPDQLSGLEVDDVDLWSLEGLLKKVL